jgi:hypothetical protein
MRYRRITATMMTLLWRAVCQTPIPAPSAFPGSAAFKAMKQTIVETKYGKIIFRNVKLFKPSAVTGDMRASFTGDAENQTGGAWRVLQFEVRFHCPGNDHEVAYLISAAALNVGFTSVSDPTPVRAGEKYLFSEPACEASDISMRLVGGTNDREKIEAEEKRLAELAKFPVLDSGAPSLFIGSDRKCAEQFVQTLSMEGLAKHKQLADLILYGCGFVEDGNVHAMRLKTEGSYCQVKLIEGKHPNRSGWVPCSWLK